MTEAGSPQKGGKQHRWGAPYREQIRILFTRTIKTRRFEALSTRDFLQFLIVGVLAGETAMPLALPWQALCSALPCPCHALLCPFIYFAMPSFMHCSALCCALPPPLCLNHMSSSMVWCAQPCGSSTWHDSAHHRPCQCTAESKTVNKQEQGSRQQHHGMTVPNIGHGSAHQSTRQ